VGPADAEEEEEAPVDEAPVDEAPVEVAVEALEETVLVCMVIMVVREEVSVAKTAAERAELWAAAAAAGWIKTLALSTKGPFLSSALLRRKKKACRSRLPLGRVPAVHMKEFCEMGAPETG
jgi:hypothetical protein